MLRLLVLLVTFNFASYAESVPPSWGTAYVLSFNSEANAKKYRPLPNLTKLRSFSRYVVVSSNKAPDFAVLKLKLFGLVRVQHVEKLTLVENTNNPDVATSQGLVQSGADPTDITGSISAESQSGTRAICPLIGSLSVHRLANENIIQQANLDLMNQEMKDLKVKPDAMSVAMVDGNLGETAKGFEGTITIGNAFSPSSSPSSVSVYNQHMNHGTEVADALLTASPNSRIASYQSFDGHVANDDEADKMVEQACKDGNKVINLSASNNGTPLQSAYPQLQGILSVQGCILIEASGNNRDALYPLDENRNKTIITVSAVDATGAPASFSTPGLIGAPGVALKLKDATQNQAQPQSGTSFAAPIVTAVTKNIYSVLARSSDWEGMAPKDRVATVEKVLLDSRLGQNVDGYRAIALAGYVTRSGAAAYLKDKTGPAYVANAMADQHLSKPDNCAAMACKERVACYTMKRKFLAAYPASGTGKDWQDLQNTANNANDSSLAAQWATLYRNSNKSYTAGNSGT
jgi:hypothetical protein